MTKLTKYQLSMLAGGVVSVILAYRQQYYDNWFGMTEQTQLWLNGSYLNLGWGLIASVIVIFLYNRVQDGVREEELIRRRKIALSLLHQALKSLLSMLVAMYYVTTTSYNKPDNTSMKDFFDEDYFNNTIHLDFGKPLHPNDPRQSHIMWFSTIAVRFDRLTSVTDTVIRKYSDYLEPDMIDLMERMNHSFFVGWAKGLTNSFKQYNQNEKVGLKIPYLYPGRMDGAVPEGFQEFVSDFITLIDFYNRWVDSDKRIKLSLKSVSLGNALLEQEQLEYQEKSIRESLILRGKLKEG